MFVTTCVLVYVPQESTLEAGWLALVFTALWKGEGAARAVRAPKGLCCHHHPRIPCLWTRSLFSAQVPSPGWDVLGVALFPSVLASWWEFLEGPQIYAPVRSPSLPPTVPEWSSWMDPHVWLVHLVRRSPAGWWLSRSPGSLFSDVVGQHPGRRRHCLFCGCLGLCGLLFPQEQPSCPRGSIFCLSWLRQLVII